MTFSWAQAKSDAVEIKQRRARTQCKAGHSDMRLKHPDWVRDARAASPNYTLINKKIKEECEKAQIRQETFTRKLHEDG